MPHDGRKKPFGPGTGYSSGAVQGRIICSLDDDLRLPTLECLKKYKRRVPSLVKQCPSEREEGIGATWTDRLRA